MSEALIDLSLVEAAEAVRKGNVTSEKLTITVLDRLETLGRELNCVMSIDRTEAVDTAMELDRERAAGRLRGPLHGVPLAHKDLFFRAGRIATSGSPLFATYRPDKTATAIRRLEEKGAVTVGSLHMAEFAFSPTGYNLHFGHGRNPWNLDHVPGGSSSGSAAAVAARLVWGSLGTDTGGSLRHPAAMCGVVGLKPTLTRVSRAGVFPLSYSLDCVGTIARTARDAARLLKIIAGPDDADASASSSPVPDYESGLNGDIRGLRIAVPKRYYHDVLHSAVARILDEDLRILVDLGAELIETKPCDMGPVNDFGQMLMAVEAAHVHRDWLREDRNSYAEVVRSRIEPGLLVPATHYVAALSARERIVSEYLSTTLKGADIAFLPAIPIPVPTIAETTTGDPQKIGETLGAVSHCTRGINYLGLPSVSVPGGFTDNDMPCAFQLVGKPFEEERLLQAAYAFQCQTDWHFRIPPCSVTSSRHSDQT